MYYWDAHSHPQFAAYDNDRDELISRAKNADVKMIAVGTTLQTSHEAVKFAESNSEIAWATVGVHPSHFSANWFHDENELRVSERESFDAQKLEELARHPKVVAIGECGLDFFRDKQPETLEAQRQGFIAQMAISYRLKKPLMIHCRAAFPELIATLKENRSLLLSEAGIIHFFTGTAEEAQEFLTLGFSFTFGGVITFTADYDEVVKLIPSERILSETDAPYVSPAPYRGKRNDPSYVTHVLSRLAELKGLSVEEMKGVVSGNIRRLFGIA